MRKYNIESMSSVACALMLAVAFSMNLIQFAHADAQQAKLNELVKFVEFEKSRVVALRKVANCETDAECGEAWHAAFGVEGDDEWTASANDYRSGYGHPGS